MGAATAVFHLPRMKPGQVHEDLFTIPTARRAVIVVGPVRSVRADPLHLLRRQVLWTEPEDLFVHPKTTALAGSAAGFIRDLEGMPTTDLSSADVSFHALRDYVPGDDRRHIHWKTTARTNKLMVRQFEETRRAHLAISLSINTDEYASDDEFELAISAAASIGRQAIREQRDLDVLTQRGPLRCETGRNMLDDMTRIVGAPQRKTAVDLARSLADTVPNASVVFLVVGSNRSRPPSCAPPPSPCRPASAASPSGSSAGAAPARANIGDLTVLTLGDLQDLAHRAAEGGGMSTPNNPEALRPRKASAANAARPAGRDSAPLSRPGTSRSTPAPSPSCWGSVSLASVRASAATRIT